MQLVRQLQGPEENPFGEEGSTTPKKVFQLLNQVACYCYDLSNLFHYVKIRHLLK